MCIIEPAVRCNHCGYCQVSRALVTRRTRVDSVLVTSSCRGHRSTLEAACDVDLYTGSEAISREELLERVGGKDALVCLLTDAIDAAVLDAAGP